MSALKVLTGRAGCSRIALHPRSHLEEYEARAYQELWGLTAAQLGGYDRPLAEIAGLFDTVYVAFDKGLGGLAGAALAGPQWVIDEVNIWLFEDLVDAVDQSVVRFEVMARVAALSLEGTEVREAVQRFQHLIAFE